MSDKIRTIRYTEEQAIEDGLLVQPYPDRWPWLLISASIHAVCKDTSADSRSYDDRLIPLLNDCILAVLVREETAEETRKEIKYPIELEFTVANTVWIMPNAKGSITVMQPWEC